jgi:succinate dehydrogenase/fumarate reductase-like Fe-S protein
MSPSSHPKPEDSSKSGSLRIVPLEPGSALRFGFDGATIEAAPGETISAALYAGGQRVLRTTSLRAEPRGLFCNMGVCFDCLVEVDGQPNVRACQTVVRAGMQVRTQHGTGLPRHVPPSAASSNLESA